MTTGTTPDGPERRLFDQALDQPAGPTRDAWLVHTCAGDPGLAERLRALLFAHEDGSAFPADDDARSPAAHAPSEKAGDLIGRYKLLQQIGEGGFGTVWMAEQTEPVTRRVALKIIKLGMDTREVIARFEQERQALAMMDHPNIAKVYDAGATDTGRPFFVMELVKGVPITQYCDEAGLGTRERLAVFADVCAAIQHAHQKGVIHRDIKPSNVMVTLYADKPIVKVIDFGIAKATQGKLTDKTLFTQFEQFIGTPAYMSPEQAALSAVDIDTRSDIYSLGVLLYELLTGKPPFDAKSLLSAGYDEMRRIIREVEPPKPSSRLSTIVGEDRTLLSRTHRIDPNKLSRLVEADLDWIVMKAIEKDRTRRYETATGLAADIGRFLADEAVTARPPSTSYQFRKFARRNKAALRVAGVIAAVLVAATIVSTWQAVRATQAEKQATDNLVQVAAERDAKELARQDAEATSKLFIDIFQSPDPTRDGRTITVAETLDRAAKKLDTHLPDQPERRAILQATLAGTYRGLGLSLEAIPLQETVRGYYFATYGPEHQSTTEAVLALAYSYEQINRIDEATTLFDEVRNIRARVLGPEHPETLRAMQFLANVWAISGRKPEALKMREQLFALNRKVHGPEAPETLLALYNLTDSYFQAGRPDEACTLLDKIGPVLHRLLKEAREESLISLLNVVSLYGNCRQGEGIEMLEELLKLCRALLGPENGETLYAARTLASALLGAGRTGEAIKILEEVQPVYREVFGPEHPETLKAIHNLAVFYDIAGHSDDALKMEEEVLALSLKVLGPEHPETLGAMTNLAIAYDSVGRLDEALALQKESLEIKRRVLPKSHPYLRIALQHMVDLCGQAGRADEAAAYQAELDALP